MSKCCIKCGVEKPFTEFYKDKTKKDGLQYRCKPCDKIISTQWKLNNPEQNKQVMKKWRYNTSGVYGIYDNDKVLYVGQSVGINGRFKSHRHCIKCPKSVEKHAPESINLYNNIRSHINVSIRIIEECSREVLLQREQHYIDTLKPLYNTYKNG